MTTLEALLDALAAPRCVHCFAALDRRNINSDGGLATCYACHRDSPVIQDEHLLLVLADYLEEHGDPRAEGLRQVGDRRPRRHYDDWYGWRGIFVEFEPHQPYDLAAANRKTDPPEVYNRLPGGASKSYVGKYYPTRSAAFLALAEALVGGQ